MTKTPAPTTSVFPFPTQPLSDPCTSKNKTMRPRPLHPFPCLVRGIVHDPSAPTRPLTDAQRHILEMLSNGARVLFDIQAKRGLIYTFRSGVKTLMEISVRMLSRLLHSGRVIMVGRQGRLVHYALAGSSSWWYQPE